MGVSVATRFACDWGRSSRGERALRPWARLPASGTLPGMFARYFVELAGSRNAIEGIVLDAPETWLPTLATSANHRRGLLLAELGFGDEVRIARTVTIAV